jgi:hypothetical protein
MRTAIIRRMGMQTTNNKLLLSLVPVLFVTLAACGGGGANNHAPQITGAALSTNEDQAGTVTLTATDADSDTLSASIATQPAKGAATVSGSNPFTVTFTPAADRNGADTFSVNVFDGHGGTATATVTVTIAPQPDPPVLAAQTFNGNEDSVLTGQVAGSDADGDTLAYSALSQPAHGTLALSAGGAITYTPAPNYFGSDSFSAQVSDGGTTRSATITLALAAVNDAPVATDDGASIAASGATSVDVLANDSDIDGDALSVSVEAQPHGATAAVVNNQLQITPDAGALGPTSLQYRVADGAGGSAVGTLSLVMGAPRALFYFTGGSGTPERRIRRYDFRTNVELATPVPAGDSLGGFVTSDDGGKMVYETVHAAPIRHRLWVRDLVDLSAPVTEIDTAGGVFVSELRLSPDGTLVAFDDRLASTASSLTQAIDGSGIGIQHPTFTRDSRKLFYTVNLAGGGRIIKRADVSAAGAITNRLQMTANYNAGEGAGIEFRLTPDETRIVSLGLFMAPPMAGGSIKQYAVVTTADGSMNDQRVHPEFTTTTDIAASLPETGTDSRYVVYLATLNGTTGAFASDLQGPGGAVNIAADSPFVSAVIANGATRALYGQTTLQPRQTVWYSRSFAPSGPPVEFAPLVNPRPSLVAAVPGSTGVLFDSGRSINLTPGYPFQSSAPLGSLPASDPSPTLIKVSPDSGSALAVGSTALTGLVVNPKAPGWNAVLDPSPADTSGTVCVAWAGQGC